MSNSNGAHTGNGRADDGKVRVAIVGVGNCASSLVQGRYYYENANDDDFVPGLMHVNLGGYHVRDIEFVAAFDIDKNKVGKDLGEAIYQKPNNTYVFHQVGKLGGRLGPDVAHVGRVVEQDLGEGGPDVRGDERRGAGQALVEDAAERERVGAGVDLAAAARLLGRHVRRGSDHEAGLGQGGRRRARCGWWQHGRY